MVQALQVVRSLQTGGSSETTGATSKRTSDRYAVTQNLYGNLFDANKELMKMF